jgi:hypothetical protein
MKIHCKITDKKNINKYNNPHVVIVVIFREGEES